jgi:hypothetical protein
MMSPFIAMDDLPLRRDAKEGGGVKNWMKK